jgi:hypothetical protein
VECPFWKELVAALGRLGFRYDLGDRRTMPAFRSGASALADLVLRRPFSNPWYETARDAAIAAWPPLRREVRRLLSYNEAFIEEVVRLTGGSVFVDASKDGVRVKYLSRIRSLEVRVVQLVRDGRAVINSARKNEGAGAARAAAEWREQHLEIERVARRCCGGRLLRVRYEDLCQAPAEWAQRILEFGGLRGERPAERVDGRGLHVLGNRMRLRGAQAVRVDETWRQELKDADRLTFERIAGRLNRRYGYGAEPAGGVVVPPVAEGRKSEC